MPILVSIITVFEELYKPFLQTSLLGRACQAKLIDVFVENLFSHAQPKKRIDAPAYGPGAGMLIRPDIVQRAIEKREQESGKAFKIFFSPQGQKIDQRLLERLAEKIRSIGHVMLIAPRYEGVDARAEEVYADSVLSIGDFVLMGGDLPALLFLEAFLRLIPGVVGCKESVERDSFSGPFVDYPSFTEPLVWLGRQVPDILRSGNHDLIEKWRLDQAAKKTVLQHFAWLRVTRTNDYQQESAWKHIPPHYVVLLHSDVLVGPDLVEGTTSVTSLDIHDIARSATTYGFKKFFIVTPLLDQQKIVNKLLDFWQNEEGKDYNPNRYQALERVLLLSSLDEVVAYIHKMENEFALLIGTSADRKEHTNAITFFDQEKVWAAKRPVLFLLGTGNGLSGSVIQKTDFFLEPIYGFMKFNHLSVRSAAAILFDRWLGLSPRS